MSIKPAVWFTPPKDGPGVATPAASLATAAALLQSILKKTKTRRVAELEGVIPAPLRLTANQLELLNEHRDVLAYVPSGVRLSACPECGRWILAKTAIKRCVMSTGCDGELLSCKAFLQAKAVPQEDLTPAVTGD